MQKVFTGKACQVYFDGGKETIGVVGINANANIEFIWGEYSTGYCTNNIAEMMAAQKAVELGLKQVWQSACDYL